MSSKAVKASRLLPAKPTDITASLVGSVNCKADSDAFNCWMTGAVLLSDDKIAVCDLTNECVKLIDIGLNKVTARIRTKRKPWALAKLDSGSNTSLHITIPNKQTIQCFKISPSGGLTSSNVDNFKTDGDCHGIAGYKGFLIVTISSENCRVDMMDASGAVIRTFPTARNGVPLFTTPDSVCINVSQTAMFISDSNNHSVAGISVDSTILGVFKDESFQEIRGVATDLNGNIYLCSLTGDSIHMLTPAFKKVKVILGEEDGVRRPSSLLYRVSDHTLIVGSKDNIKLFLLK